MSRQPARLERVAFKTSRLLDFVGKRELIAQTGHAVADWPVVILKETVDNAIDACEEAKLAPVLAIDISTAPGAAGITISDNGPGIAVETIADILDYTVRVSSREAYVSPTRGAQGNALKTLVALPYALDGSVGETRIESRGAAHCITFTADRIRQEPRLERVVTPSSIKTGAFVTVFWPDSASSILISAKARFLQIADDFAWFNPHLTLRVRWDGETVVEAAPTLPDWPKWRPSDPTSAHWYDAARLERYAAAHVSRDQDHGRERTVREFIAEFRGLSGSAKQKLVLDDSGTARLSLAAFLGNGRQVNHAGIDRLLAAMQRHTRPIKAHDLGVIGRDHLLARFQSVGVQPETFRYKSVIIDPEDNGVPAVIETAFAWRPKALSSRRIIAGVNWSVALGNPFRSFGHREGLESLLADQRAGRNEPIVFVLHLASPRIEFSDRGKTALVIAGKGEDDERRNRLIWPAASPMPCATSPSIGRNSASPRSVTAAASCIAGAGWYATTASQFAMRRSK
jgi:DNA topoisomerase VI subunit B